MDEHGKNQLTLIEEYYDHDEPTLHIQVFTDPGMLQVIESVAGVESAYRDSPRRYSVFLDPRYDRRVVMREIFAALETEAERRKSHDPHPENPAGEQERD